MLVWDDCQTLAQKLTNDDSATALTTLKLWLNEGYKEILADVGVEQTEKRQTANTVADQRSYKLPQDFVFAKSVTVTVGSTKYSVFEEESREMWELRTKTTQTSDIPEKYFIEHRFWPRGGELLIDPVPASASNTIEVVYSATAPDLATDKYTTGSIAVTNGSATVTGSGTTFTGAMVDRFLKITDEDGDGQWYRISAVASGTSLTLENTYAGSTDGTANYQISEAFALPEEMQKLPVYYAAAMYYSEKKDETNELKHFAYFTDGVERGRKRHHKKSTSGIVRGGDSFTHFTEYPDHFPTNAT